MGGHPLAANLLDFWRWSASDLVSNATRGILAEFIVAQALGLETGVRAEWDAYDLVTSAGLNVEVKSSAYLQSWFHKELSAISFGIRPTFAWSTDTNELATERAVFHRPHPQPDTNKDAVKSVRRFLKEAGVQPG